MCLDGVTVHVASASVERVEAGRFADTMFVAFDVTGQGRFAVVREVEAGAGDDGKAEGTGDRTGAGASAAWSAALPAGDELRLRTPAFAAPEGRFVVAQLATPMLTAWRDALAARGVTVHAYIPDNAFLVRLPDADGDTEGDAGAGATGPFDADALSALPFVQRVLGLAPEAKVEPGLLTRNEAGEGETLLVHVLSVPGAPGAFEAVRDGVAAMGGATVFEVPVVERITAQVPAGRLRDLAALPEVWWIDQASLEAETDMDKVRAMTGSGALQVAAPRGFQGSGVVGMVMDVGFEPGHRDFEKSLLGLACPTGRSSHGTSVYGIVFGSGEGDPTATGMAPEAKGMMAYYRCGLSRYETAQQVAAQGGIFHTNSWGEGVPKDNTYDSHSNENDRVVMDLGVLMLQSMSNCGPGCARREAMAKNILSVGALYHEDTATLVDDAWGAQGTTSRASTGPAADGRIKPELVGPYDDIRTTSLNNGYTNGFGGTSGATPVVAGAVALAQEMATAGVFGPLPAGAVGASPAALKALLVASAEAYLPHQVSFPPVGHPAWDVWRRDVQGWGLPDLESLHAAGPAALLRDEAQPLGTGGVAVHAFEVPEAAQALRVSLAWTDAPANPGAGVTLVNDLDLEVVGPAGVVYRGNAGLRSGPYSSEGGEPDRLNNLENVFVLLPEPGTWTLRVRGAAVNLDADPGTPGVDQPFALVALLTDDLDDPPLGPVPTPPLPPFLRPPA